MSRPRVTNLAGAFFLSKIAWVPCFFTPVRARKACVDFKKPDGTKIAKVNVVVENFAPGVMARLGLDYESLAKLNSKIVIASCSGFGQTRPLSKNTS